VTTRLLYLVGPPGVGKSSAMRGLLRGLGLNPMDARRAAPQVYLHDLVGEKTGRVEGQYLGRLRREFPGTDALGMSASPRVISYLASPGLPPLILGEGARLGTGKFFQEAATNSRLRLSVALLDAPDEVLEQRRDRRGSGQDASWARGAATRARNAAAAAEQLGIETHRIDAVGSVEGVVERLASLVR